MLIVNNKILREGLSKNDELYSFLREYEEGIKNLERNYPRGVVQIKRIGYPKTPPPSTGDIILLPEPAPPIYIKATRDVNGVLWGYCSGRPVIHPNGLVEVPDNANIITLDGEYMTVDYKQRPDYAFYLIYKSGILGLYYEIYDPEGEAIRQAEEKNRYLKMQYLIREGMSEDKCRAVAASWGVTNVGSKHLAIVQEELEKKIIEGEKKKKESGYLSLSIRGIDEFIEEIKSEDWVRPKAIVQMAIDANVVTFRATDSSWYMGDQRLCYVPLDKTDEKREVLTRWFSDENNREIWHDVLRSVVDEDYISSLSKWGLRWLAGEFDIPLNQSIEKLKDALVQAIKA